ncbi:hypothetical protein IFHNHDMJ_02429 [Synechococcus sp. CBW1107]|nr:hypothetical protein IFHNHDMJ_02429 [Synechococcus sp. CBW1107]
MGLEAFIRGMGMEALAGGYVEKWSDRSERQSLQRWRQHRLRPFST